MRLQLACLALLCGWAFSSGVRAQVQNQPVPGLKRLAVWRLEPLGIEAETAERLELLLRAEAGRIKGYTLQPQQQTQAILSAKPVLAKCPGKTKCLCKIARTLGAEKLITGVIGALGEDYTFDLKLIDAKTCREERRINEALSGRADLLIGAIRQALYKLAAPELVVGSLLVAVPMAGAAVELDGKQVGITPLKEAITGLKLGKHSLRIHKEGYSAFSHDVPVRFAQTTRVKVDLIKSVLVGLSYQEEGAAKPAPVEAVRVVRRPAMGSIEKAAWITGGVALVTAAAAGVMAWRTQVLEDELEQAASATVPYLNASHQDTYQDGETYALLANVGWGLAGAAALSSVVLFSLELAGVGEESEEALKINPTIGPEGAGAVLRWNF